MDKRTLNIEFEASFKNVDVARFALQGICFEFFGKNSESAADLIMAANEAMNNAVEHTDSSVVKVEVVWCPAEIWVLIISSGMPFNPVEAVEGVSQEDMLERDEGGYGLFLIRELVDSFEYEYRNTHNVWKLRKNICL